MALDGGAIDCEDHGLPPGTALSAAEPTEEIHTSTHAKAAM
jgi:hypothetical protein